MCKRKEFIPCRSCPSRQNPGPNPGYYYDELDGFKVLKECSCHKKWKEEQELIRKFESANLTTDYAWENYKGTKSLESFNDLKMIAEKPERFLIKHNYYLWGPNGTQKTSMSQVLGQELIKKGYSAQYILMGDLLTNLIKDFDDNNKEAKEIFIRKCMEVDFLIIDEAWDKSKTTLFSSGYQIPFLDTFIRNRYDLQGKPTLFISNHKPEEIESQGFGVSLQNLICRTTTGALLEFEDEYIQQKAVADVRSLFSEGN